MEETHSTSQSNETQKEGDKEEGDEEVRPQSTNAGEDTGARGGEHEPASETTTDESRLASTTGGVSTSSPPSDSSSDVDKRVCRICQSETGDMVQPCACTGSMSSVHGQCLNKWFIKSNKTERCEICHQPYSTRGHSLLPIWKWHRPVIETQDVIECISVVCLSLWLIYMYSLMAERDFVTRIFVHGLPLRAPDIARILLMTLIGVPLIAGTAAVLATIWGYVNKQREVRFINFQKQCIVKK